MSINPIETLPKNYKLQLPLETLHDPLKNGLCVVVVQELRSKTDHLQAFNMQVRQLSCVGKNDLPDLGDGLISYSPNFKRRSFVDPAKNQLSAADVSRHEIYRIRSRVD